MAPQASKEIRRNGKCGASNCTSARRQGNRKCSPRCRALLASPSSRRVPLAAANAAVRDDDMPRPATDDPAQFGTVLPHISARQMRATDCRSCIELLTLCLASEHEKPFTPRNRLKEQQRRDARGKPPALLSQGARPLPRGPKQTTSCLSPERAVRTAGSESHGEDDAGHVGEDLEARHRVLMADVVQLFK